MLNQDKDTAEGYKNKLTNKLFGLLCEREKKNGTWKLFLDNILIELWGVKEVFSCINFWELFSKTSALRFLNYEEFRTTIFDCMNLIKGLEVKNELPRFLQK